MLSKAITWLKKLGSSLLRRSTTGNPVTGPTKAQRLAWIARERALLKNRLEEAKRQKKARKHLYVALESLRREELLIESGQ